MPEEDRRRHEAAKKRGRADQRHVGAERSGAPRCRNGRARRFAAGAGNEEPPARHGLARRRDHLVRFVIVEQRGFPVRAQRDHTAQTGAHPARDVCGDGPRVDLAVGERRRHRREDGGKRHESAA
jgi:hypothetical protein